MMFAEMLAIAVAVGGRETSRPRYECEVVGEEKILSAARSDIKTSKPNVNRLLGQQHFHM